MMFFREISVYLQVYNYLLVEIINFKLICIGSLSIITACRPNLVTLNGLCHGLSAYL